MGVSLQLILGLLLVLATCSLAESPPPPRENATEINNRDLNKILKKSDTKTDNLDPKDKNYINDQFPLKLSNHNISWSYSTTTPTIPFEGTRHPSFDTNDELTTPVTAVFDNKFKETVESVDQKLDLDHEEHEGEEEEEEREKGLNVEDLLKNMPENATLVYENTKDIVNNETIEKNSIHKDVNVEQIKKLKFENFFNETIVYENDNIEGVKGEETSTKKSVKQSEEERTTLHLLSNKIESEDATPAKGNMSTVVPPSNTISTTITSTTTTTTTSTTMKTKADLDSVSASTRTQPPTLLTRSNISDQENIIPLKLGTTKPVFIDSTIEEITSSTTPKSSETTFKLMTTINTTSQKNFETTTTSKEPEMITTTTVPIDLTTLLVSESISSTTRGTSKPTETISELMTTTSSSTATTTFKEPEATTTATVPTDLTTLAESTTLINQIMSDATTIIIPEETTLISVENNASTTFESSTIKEQLNTIENATLNVDNASSTYEVVMDSSTKPKQEEELSTAETTTVLDETSSGTSTALVDEEPHIITTQMSFTSVVLDDTNNSTAQENINEISKDDRGAITTTEESIISTILPIVSTTTLEVSSKIPATRGGSRANILKANVTEEVITTSSITTEEVNDLTDSVITTTENNTEISPSDSFTKENSDSGDNKGKIAAIVISSVGAVCLVLLAGLLYVMKKRQKRQNYVSRCRPVSLDDYSVDNLSVYNSVRRKGGAARMSKRSFGNPAFDDPVAPSHPLNFAALVKFATNYDDIKAEFDDVPQITAKTSELPEGCDTKNRYANVIPLPETRVYLNFIDGYPNSDYINANYVTGPKNTKGYYIATQGPMQNTVDDFWRMVWEQQTKLILMLTHLVENGLEKCVDYLPESEVLECSRIFGDFQITLKKREVKEKYIISNLQLKNMVSNSWREVTHFWYLGWPEKGVPNEANSLIAFLIEARSYMKSSTMDKKDGFNGIENGGAHAEHSPVVVHCSPGTGRTGVTIACDIAIREFETTRLVDIPKIVYRIRRDRANAVQTKEQYSFIYKVVSLYATKLTGGALENL